MVASLPSDVIIAYANWGECDAKMERAAAHGVNVIIWFAIQLVTSATNDKPAVVGGPNLTCVASVAASLRARNLSTHPFISVGGRHAPHEQHRRLASKCDGDYPRHQRHALARGRLADAHHNQWHSRPKHMDWRGRVGPVLDWRRRHMHRPLAGRRLLVQPGGAAQDCDAKPPGRDASDDEPAAQLALP